MISIFHMWLSTNASAYAKYLTILYAYYCGDVNVIHISNPEMLSFAEHILQYCTTMSSSALLMLILLTLQW